jgi:two-component system NtrC family response regulator
VNGNVSKAAELLGVSRPTLYDLMEKYGLRT